MLSNRWINQIDRTTDDFSTTFKDLTKEKLNYKPAHEVWSIAQNIHHLILINESYFLMLDKIKNGEHTLPWIAKVNFLANFFGKVILNSVSPERRKKMKTFAIWEPSTSNLEETILSDFAVHQEKLKEYILTSNNWIEQGLVISSPANKNIVYKLEKAFDIIVTHEQRHFEQAKELLQVIK